MRKLFTILLLLLIPALGMADQKPTQGAQINWTHPLARGLVGAWLMNEGSGSKVNDLSRNGNDGIINSGTWKYGILSFTDGYVNIGKSIPKNFSNQFTCVIKFRLNAAPATYQLIYSDWYDNTHYSIHFAISDTVKPMLQLSSTGANYDNLTAPNALSAGNIYVEAATFNAGLFNLYENGKISATPKTSGTVKSIFTGTVNDVWLFKKNQAPQPAPFPFLADVEYCYVFNRALTASEVAWLYQDPYAMFQRQNYAMNYGVAAAPGGIKWQVPNQAIIISKK